MAPAVWKYGQPLQKAPRFCLPDILQMDKISLKITWQRWNKLFTGKNHFYFSITFISCQQFVDCLFLSYSNRVRFLADWLKYLFGDICEEIRGGSALPSLIVYLIVLSAWWKYTQRRTTQTIHIIYVYIYYIFILNIKKDFKISIRSTTPQSHTHLSKGRFFLSPFFTQSSSCFWVLPLRSANRDNPHEFWLRTRGPFTLHVWLLSNIVSLH